ncbi:hypothetical protein F4678DRAFT_452861 [Xylaria arbuscula]|nr:hypothetical protein F4678DRAFT_452861 [Xylaria arbuscula]
MKPKLCNSCNKCISAANFARHQQRHRKPNRITCHQCHELIHIKGLSQHMKTHLSQATSAPEISSREQTEQLPAQAQLFPQSLWSEFLAITNVSISPLLNVFEKEIRRAGGLSQLHLENASIWDSVGVLPPLLFPAEECWIEKPPMEQYMSDLIINSDENTAIFCRGSPRQPLIGRNIFKVIRQLFEPEIISALCAVNMTTELPEVRIPQRFYGRFSIYENCHEVRTNITPKFSGVDLHVDCGWHGITLLYGGCVKLWALYPLTMKNYNLLAKAYRLNAMFIELQG